MFLIGERKTGATTAETSRRGKNMKSKKMLFYVSCFLALVLFAAHETLLNFFPEARPARSCLKFFISVIPFCLSFAGWKSNKNGLNFFILLGLFICCLADVFINIVFVAAIVLYLLGHLCFIRAFLSCKRPRVFNFVLWAILYLAICLGILFLTDVPFDKRAEGLVYCAFMCAMVAFSFCGPALIRAGGIIFGLSDVLLMVNIVLGIKDGPSHVAALGIYYVGVFLMAAQVFLRENANPQAASSD